MSSYLDHGPRHGRHGSDQIPGAFLPWAYYTLTFGAVADGASAFSSWSTGGFEGFFYTDNTEIFGTGTSSETGGGTLTGPVIKEPGLYRWTCGIVDVTHLTVDGDFGFQFAQVDFGFSNTWGDANHMHSGQVSFQLLAGADADAVPTQGQIFEATNNTGTGLTLNGFVLVEQLSTFEPAGGYSGNL